LQRLLNTNGRVCIPPESTLLALLYKKYHAIKSWNKSQISNFCKDVFLDEKLTNWWKLEPSQLESYLREKKPQNYKEALFYAYQIYASTIGKKEAILGDKNPANSLYIKEMLATFPSAKFIIMVRNPVDNVYSFKNVAFDSNETKVLAHRWDYYNNEMLTWKKQFPKQFHVTKFESLITNTETELKAIADFLSVENVFEIEKKEEGKQAWQQNLKENISTKHINKGRKGLTKDEINYIESVCAFTANQYGYNMLKKESHFSFYAWLFNRLEKHFIKLPLYISTSVLKFYRRKKKIIVEN